jgi:hypothetical protein
MVSNAMLTGALAALALQLPSMSMAASVDFTGVSVSQSLIYTSPSAQFAFPSDLNKK